jgi:hypothetical protein
MVINRRTFSAALVAGAAASLTSTRGTAATATATKSRNVVLVHGLGGLAVEAEFLRRLDRRPHHQAAQRG